VLVGVLKSAQARFGFLACICFVPRLKPRDQGNGDRMNRICRMELPETILFILSKIQVWAYLAST
jgi:hypothetical protein